MRHDPLEEVLRPARDAELGGPRWQGFSLRLAKERAAGEWAVDDDVHLALGGERQQALLRVALGEGVIDLHEVVGAGLEPALDFAVRRCGVVRDAQVPDPSLLAPRLHGFGVRGDVEQVVHLHEVHHFHAQALEGLFHLRDAVLAAARPHLGGDEEPLAHLQFGDQVAGDGLRAAVHGRGVDDVAIEQLQHLAQRRPRGGIISGVECLPRTESDLGELHCSLRKNAARICAQAGGEDRSPARVHESILAVIA